LTNESNLNIRFFKIREVIQKCIAENISALFSKPVEGQNTVFVFLSPVPSVSNYEKIANKSEQKVLLDVRSLIMCSLKKFIFYDFEDQLPVNREAD
jgi:hypothetical protein